MSPQKVVAELRKDCLMEKLASVLLVDDNSTANFLNDLMLSAMGVTEHIVVAENGQEALALLARTVGTAAYPALILLDVHMPIMGGEAFLEAYQQLPAAQQKASLIVLLTTTVHEGELARLRQLPVAALLDKPLTKEKVTALLHEHFPQPLP